MKRHLFFRVLRQNSHINESVHMRTLNEMVIMAPNNNFFLFATAFSIQFENVCRLIFWEWKMYYTSKSRSLSNALRSNWATMLEKKNYINILIACGEWAKKNEYIYRYINCMRNQQITNYRYLCFQSENKMRLSSLLLKEWMNGKERERDCSHIILSHFERKKKPASICPVRSILRCIRMRTPCVSCINTKLFG